MLLHEKADQAQALLQETGLDCWLTFARETGIHPDPGVEAVVGADVVRNSAFLFGGGGERIAIVARFDVAIVRSQGVFAEVLGYDEDIRLAAQVDQFLLVPELRRDPLRVEVGAVGVVNKYWPK